MKITVLDALTTNPGDLSWARLAEFGEYTVYDRTAPELVYERCKDCEIVITNKTSLRREMLERLPKLQYVGLLSTGFNAVDFEYCKERGIPVCNIPTYGTAAVAQMTFAHILSFTNAVDLHNDAVKEGQWSSCPDFCFWNTPLSELQGKTIGLIGYGKIGREVAKIAIAFGMHVLVEDVSPPDQNEGVEFTDINSLIKQSDFVSLHCPLTPQTIGMVGTDFLSKMKKNAYLINTARGPIINESELAAALNNGVIAGAGLDVLAEEPPAADNPLFNCPNCHITPHISWAAHETRARLLSIFYDNIAAFINGKPINLVY